jgi:hypothetical protein
VVARAVSSQKQGVMRVHSTGPDRGQHVPNMAISKGRLNRPLWLVRPSFHACSWIKKSHRINEIYTKSVIGEQYGINCMNGREASIIKNEYLQEGKARRKP